MNREGTRLLDDGVIVFDGHDADLTVEGPKFYKLNGWYYILAPAGGVATGWQLALRSKNIYGPYDKKVVLSQGKSKINGPHQGGLVDTPAGEWWFLHFQDKGAYGRVLYLEPVTWTDGFPVIGLDADCDGTGEPVVRFRKPHVGKSYPIKTPQDTDEFDGNRLGPQWQWHANPEPGWAFPFPQKGVLRMYAVKLPDVYRNLWDLPNLLLQKFPAEEFTATAKVRIDSRSEGERFGLLIMGIDYVYLGVTNANGDLYISQATAKDADKGSAETQSTPIMLPAREIYLRATIKSGAICSFRYSLDGKNFTAFGNVFNAREGRWIGAKIGFFFTRSGKFNDAGSADIDWIRFEK